jgi:hypothetical protein
VHTQYHLIIQNFTPGRKGRKERVPKKELAKQTTFALSKESNTSGHSSIYNGTLRAFVPLCENKKTTGRSQ